MKTAEEVAVIGSGIAGLTCAYELQRVGFSVQVYEREARPGGRMRTRRQRGLSFDLGANFLVKAYSTVGQLARELGVPLQNLSPVRHALYRAGQFHRMNFESARDAVRMDAMGIWSKVRFLQFVLDQHRRHGTLSFFDLSRNPESLNLEDAYSFACREIGPEFADYILDAFHTCMMFYRSRETSAAAFLALFSMKTDPSYDFSVLHASGEMGDIPDAMASKLAIRLNCPVFSVSRKGNGWQVETADSKHSYRWVVLATTAAVARKILVDEPIAQRAVLRGTRYATTINVAYRLPQDALDERTHCYYVPFRESSLISEFTNEALKGGRHVHEGCSLVNVGLHEAAARALMAADDDAIFALVRAELGRLYPGLSSAEPHDLQRWPEAMPKYDCGHLRRVNSFLREGQGQGGLYLCGDYLNAPWLEGACRCGWRVADALALAAYEDSASPIDASTLPALRGLTETVPLPSH